MIELRCSKRNSIEEEPEISVQADCDLCVEVVWSGKKKYINVKKDCNGTV